MHSPTSPGLRRFARLTALSTFLLVIAGGLVTSTGSGLSVPDWPLSYGMLFPPMVGGVLYEHGHRLIAGGVALLTTLLMVWVWKSEPRRWVRRLAVAAWLTVLVQAGLGGLTVLLMLPTAVSVSHAGVAQLFFALVVLIAVVTSRFWADLETTQTTSRRLHWWTLFAVLAIYVQTLLGAWMRHSGAGLAIADFPLAYGRLIPPLSASALPELNATLALDLYVPPVERIGQVAIHFAHRVGALVVALVLFGLFLETLRRERDEPVFVGLAGLLVLLVLFQAMFGALIIWTRKAVLPTTIHVAVGALMLVTAVTYAALYRKRYTVAEREPTTVPTGASREETARA